MHHHHRYPPRALAVAVAIIILAALLKIATRAQAYTVTCGEDVHGAIARAGNPQTVTFEPGCVYRLTRRIDPANGQTFEGNGATLSGARLLENAKPVGNHWEYGGQFQEGLRRTVSGETICEADAPRCNYPETLYIDGVPMNHVDDIGKLVPGAWYFDYDRDVIAIGDDPTGRVVETSVVNCAICGGANNVTVRNLTITMFATPLENAAIEGYTPGGEGWLIENNVITLNSAIGVVVRADGIIRGNTLVRNGQSGYGAGGTQSVKAAGIVIEDNEIGWNNFKRVNPYFSAGGGKASWTTGLIFRGNYVHNNYRRGIWFDLDNSNTTIESNRVEYNANGLFLEMGGSADVRDNSFECNGTGTDGTFQTSILITNASNIVIEANEITVCAQGNAIGIREDGNPARTIGGQRRETDNVTVRNNRVIFAVGRGAVGQDAYNSGQLGRVVWTGNVYYVQNATYKHWLVEGVALSFAEWQARNPIEGYIIGMPTVPTMTPPPGTPEPPEFATMTPTLAPTQTPEFTPAVTPIRYIIRIDAEIRIEVITP